MLALLKKGLLGVQSEEKSFAWHYGVLWMKGELRKASDYEIIAYIDDDEYVRFLIEVVVEVGLVERIEMVKFLCL